MENKRLLVVDDDPKTLYALSAILGESGFTVVPCANADCVREHAKDPFHIALLDVRLIGLSGPEIAAELRLKYPSLRLVFMTAFNNIHLVKAEFPGAPVLVKPFDIPTLLQHLRAA
jgi:DNA-binding response OmpR family regulator